MANPNHPTHKQIVDALAELIDQNTSLVGAVAKNVPLPTDKAKAIRNATVTLNNIPAPQQSTAFLNANNSQQIQINNDNGPGPK